jgi:galactokinase
MFFIFSCRNFKAQTIPFDEDSSVELVVANSNVKHNLGDGEYAKRAASCKEVRGIIIFRAN